MSSSSSSEDEIKTVNTSTSQISRKRLKKIKTSKISTVTAKQRALMTGNEEFYARGDILCCKITPEERYEITAMENEIQQLIDFWSANQSNLPGLFSAVKKYAFLTGSSATTIVLQLALQKKYRKEYRFPKSIIPKAGTSQVLKVLNMQ